MPAEEDRPVRGFADDVDPATVELERQLAAAVAPQSAAPAPPVEHPSADLPAAVVADLMKRRADAMIAGRDYEDAKSEAASAKKAWDQKRELFEAAFDRAVAGVAEPSLPFDGIHQSDVVQPEQSAAPGEAPDGIGGANPTDE